MIHYGHDDADAYPHSVAEFNAENGTAGDEITGNLGANPLFADPDAGDFALLAGSPCIDAGVDLGATVGLGLASGSAWPDAVTTLAQSAHGAGWEIGAYVHVPGGSGGGGGTGGSGGSGGGCGSGLGLALIAGLVAMGLRGPWPGKPGMTSAEE